MGNYPPATSHLYRALTRQGEPTQTQRDYWGPCGLIRATRVPLGDDGGLSGRIGVPRLFWGGSFGALEFRLETSHEVLQVAPRRGL